MAFRVGERVVCINDKNWHLISGVASADTFPVCRVVYTVGGLDWCEDRYFLGLIELGWSGLNCPMFESNRFRKLVSASQAQDIAMIRQLVETIDPIVACELTYADEIEARMVALDAAMNRLDLP